MSNGFSEGSIEEGEAASETGGLFAEVAASGLEAGLKSGPIAGMVAAGLTLAQYAFGGGDPMGLQATIDAEEAKIATDQAEKGEKLALAQEKSFLRLQKSWPQKAQTARSLQT